MTIKVEYIPTSSHMEDGIFWCDHPDTNTEYELNFQGDNLLVTRCANCGTWYDECFGTFDVEDCHA